jgi:hypothetical protein
VSPFSSFDDTITCRVALSRRAEGDAMIDDTITKGPGGSTSALQASDKPERANGRQRTPQRRREAIATARIVFRCEAGLHDSIEAIAARNAVSLSEAVRLMLTTYLGNDGGRSSDLTRLAKSLRRPSHAKDITLRPRKAFP